MTFRYNPPVERMGELTEITSRFGFRGSEFHYGLDIVPLPPHDGLLRFISTGKVLREAFHPISGNFVEYEANYIDNRKWKILYAHLAKRCPLGVGEKFDVGEWAGIIGETGHATGRHVHIEMTPDWSIQRVDPEAWLENWRFIF